jgi:signal transduction histidine kinase
MDRIEPEPKKPSYEELVLQNQALRLALTESQAEKKAIWMMLAGTNRRLQMSSAAIKAAVSSMLNYDIFWDGANEHEFLETINTSVDQAGRLVKLLSLAFRLEAGNLELKREPHVLQEIISVVQDHTTASIPNLVFGITLPQEGGAVLVDYEFLMTALEYLLEVIERMGARRIGIQAVEEPGRWLLQFEGLDTPTIQAILSISHHDFDSASRLNPAITPESLLRLHIALQILQMQEIQVEIPDSPHHPSKLRLVVPIHS